MAIRHDEQMIVNGRLTQVGLSFQRAKKSRIRAAVFQCVCGNKAVIDLCHVKSGHTASCGCKGPKKTNPKDRIKKGRLTQIGTPFRARTSQSQSSLLAVFECSCGNKTITTVNRVKSGKTSSCGCFHIEQVINNTTKHGHTAGTVHSPTYRSWTRMHSRCKAKHGSHHWPYYGAKGIVVCERWGSFENFLSDMGHRPDGHTIDRKDGTKGYCTENCRWATKDVQCLNVSDIRILTHDNISLCMKDWARKAGMKYLTLWSRINNGWSVEKALTTPVRKQTK